MFLPVPWAKAFINTLEKEGGDIEESIEILTILGSWVSSLPGMVFGAYAAEKAEKLIRAGAAGLGYSSPALETAIRMMILMIKKNALSHVDSVIGAAKTLLDKKRGIVAASVEYAFPPETSSGGESFPEEPGLIEAIKKRTGALGVRLVGRVNRDLIGGYRLRIGDEIIDASVRSQLRELETYLAAGINGPGDGGIEWQNTEN